MLFSDCMCIVIFVIIISEQSEAYDHFQPIHTGCLKCKVFYFSTVEAS